MDKFIVEGCKLRCGLCEVEVLDASPPKGFLTGFLQLLAGNRINLDLLIGTESNDGLELSCVVSTDEGERLESLLPSDPHLTKHTDFRTPVELLSIFPHKGDLRAVGLSLLAFALKEVPLYGFCSSLSTLTFITDSTQSEKALSALGACFDLPEVIGTASEG